MAEPLRHRQTKEAATDMFSLQPPRHIPTLPGTDRSATSVMGLLMLAEQTSECRKIAAREEGVIGTKVPRGEGVGLVARWRTSGDHATPVLPSIWPTTGLAHRSVTLHGSCRWLPRRPSRLARFQRSSPLRAAPVIRHGCHVPPQALAANRHGGGHCGSWVLRAMRGRYSLSISAVL